MDGEDKSGVQSDPLLNNNSESQRTSETNSSLTRSSSTLSSPKRHDFLFKIALLGNTASGKTCLLKRFTDDVFSESPFLPTIGIDFRTKIIPVDDRNVKLQVWDTAGKSRFESLGEMFLSEAMGVVFCFDITDRKTFTNLPHWMNKFIGKPKKHNSNQIPSFVVGCKSDLGDDKRMVTKYEAQAFAVKHGARYMETSSKLNSGIDELFSALASSILSHTLKALKEIANSNNVPRKCSSEDDDVMMRSANTRRSLRDWSQNVSKRARSVRRSFRVISYRKKKKEKKRNNSGDLSVAKANIEGNDEARTLQASMRKSLPIDMRVSISSNPSAEDEISTVNSPTTEHVIEEKDEFKPKFKFCCM